jgi:transposase
MKTFTWFLGVDVSKDRLDMTLLHDSEQLDYRYIENNSTGIKEYFKWIKSEFKVKLSDCLVCMEYTGIYNNHLLQAGQTLGLNLWLESAINIKLSGGISRIKNDKIDSSKIAVYAYRFQDKVRLWQPPRAIVQKLNLLSKQRDKLLKIKHMLEVSIKENLLFMDKNTARELRENIRKPLDSIIVTIKTLDAKIENLIRSDEQISALAKIITSVPGVGKVTAVKMIVTTNEFQDIQDPRKYACYGGVAPFERTSGMSIRGKTQVSKKANLSVKKLLSMCAATAIKNDPEIRSFFERKVATGKNKMSVINAVRNKIIHRVFACVNQNRLFEKNFQNALA